MKQVIFRIFSLILLATVVANAERPSFPNIVNDKVCVFGLCDTSSYTFLSNHAIYAERWDTLPQAKFWRQIMTLTPDSGILNVAGVRLLGGRFSSKQWNAFSEETKQCYRDSVRMKYNLSQEDKIVFTFGKGDFYKFDAVLQSIDQAVKIFESVNTDPFYAQSILLIESPGRMQKSVVGAYGPFQLMKGVARHMGMTVNKYVDERKDFEKSALGAAKLIRTICIPQTNLILDRNGVSYNPNDLWYKLLVLHVYHAGAGNVGPVIDQICPGTNGGSMELITKVWQTSVGAFKNSSQNYSQLAIASLLELDKIIYSRCHEVASAQK